MVANTTSAKPRILLYSHDSYGLGHFRRTLTLCEGLLQELPGAEVLIVTGSPCSSLFPLPSGAGLVKLPSVTKGDGGDYVPRTLGSSFSRVLSLRKRLILESYRAFRPSLLLVDHKVIGLQGEVFELLQKARRDGVRTVLGIRDIIDTPEVVAREWSDDESRWALAEGYDRVCVYGVPEVFDPRTEYPIPAELAPRVEFTGYVVREARRANRRPVPALRPQVLFTVGGGEDGGERIDAYLEGLERRPVRWNTVLVGGPLLDDSTARRLRRRARMIGNVDVRRFYRDMPRLLSECSAVVSMAGYNTCAEVLQSRKPWVLLPRTEPRKEQGVRAERLAARGLALCRSDPNPEELRRAIQSALERPYMDEDLIPDLGGVRRLCTIVGEMLEVAPALPKPLPIEIPNREAVS